MLPVQDAWLMVRVVAPPCGIIDVTWDSFPMTILSGRRTRLCPHFLGIIFVGGLTIWLFYGATF